MSKIWFLVALVALFAWVIPTMVAFYKNQKVYNTKIKELQMLDKREGIHSNAKAFNVGVFKKDVESYFSSVEVNAIANNSYEVDIIVEKSKIDIFNAFIKKISLDYAIVVEDNLLFKEVNNEMNIKMILKPY